MKFENNVLNASTNTERVNVQLSDEERLTVTIEKVDRETQTVKSERAFQLKGKLDYVLRTIATYQTHGRGKVGYGFSRFAVKAVYACLMAAENEGNIPDVAKWYRTTFTPQYLNKALNGVKITAYHDLTRAIEDDNGNISIGAKLNLKKMQDEIARLTKELETLHE